MFDKVLESATSLRNQIHHKVEDNIKKVQEKQQHNYDLRHLRSNDIKVGDKVLLRNNKRNDGNGGRFTFTWLGPYEMDNLTDYGLASLKNQKGNVLKKKFNKLLLKPYRVSDTDHIYSGNINIAEDKKVVEEDINLFKPMEFSKSCSPNDESNESINLWNKLPDEIVETILLSAIESSSNGIQDYHFIMQTCSRFQIVKQKGKRLLPRVYIDTHEKFEHSSYQNMIKVSVRKLTKLFGQNTYQILLKKKKDGNQLGLSFVKKNIRGMSYARCTGKMLSNYLLKKKIQRFGCKMSFII